MPVISFWQTLGLLKTSMMKRLNRCNGSGWRRPPNGSRPITRCYQPQSGNLCKRPYRTILWSFSGLYNAMEVDNDDHAMEEIVGLCSCLSVIKRKIDAHRSKMWMPMFSLYRAPVAAPKTCRILVMVPWTSHEILSGCIRSRFLRLLCPRLGDSLKERRLDADFLSRIPLIFPQASTLRVSHVILANSIVFRQYRSQNEIDY